MCDCLLDRLKEKQANVHKEIEEKYPAKNNFLKNKHSKDENDQRPSWKGLDNIVERVNYKDADIEIVKPKNKVVNLGCDRVNVNMEKVLSKPPGHPVYRKVHKENVEMSIEEAMVKLRYSNIENKPNGKTKDDIQDNEQISKDMEKVINFNSMKATEMKKQQKG